MGNEGTNDDSNGDGPNGEEPSEPVETGTFDDFEDLSSWDVLDGSVFADGDRSVVGSQSARLEARSSDSSVMIKREFDSPRDLSDKLPALAVASDGPNPLIQLSDASGDRLLLEAAVEEDGPLVARNFGVTGTEGDPDLSSIVHVKISAWSGVGGTATMWCDDLRFVSRPETGTVVLQFDDGFEGIATEAAPILDEHDYPATAFVRTGLVGDDGKLDVDQLSDLADSGWTVGSHGAGPTGYDHRDESTQDAHISEAVEWLDDHGFGDDVPFAYPNGNYNETTLDLIGDYHDVAFSGGYPVHGYVRNPHLCPRVVNPSAAEAEEILDRTAEYRGITTITYRDLDSFEETIDHLHGLESDGDLQVVLPSDIESDYLD